MECGQVVTTYGGTIASFKAAKDGHYGPETHHVKLLRSTLTIVGSTIGEGNDGRCGRAQFANDSFEHRNAELVVNEKKLLVELKASTRLTVGTELFVDYKGSRIDGNTAMTLSARRARTNRFRKLASRAQSLLRKRPRAEEEEDAELRDCGTRSKRHRPVVASQ
jgi:hypothetical protein